MAIMVPRKCLFLVLFYFVPLQATVSGSVDSTSLLWPIPAQITTLDSEVMMLDPDKFLFVTDINSDILNKAFQRYMGLIFKPPAPFYPAGASLDVKQVMSKLTVKVTSGDETLNQDTDESCGGNILVCSGLCCNLIPFR